MKDNPTPKAIELKDYQAPHFFIETTDLEFELLAEKTVVTSQLKVVRNATEAAAEVTELVLSGADITLVNIEIDGKILETDAYSVAGESLTIAPAAGLLDRFTLTVRTEINPKANTSLEGLYLSNGMFCTQCEAEGFRKITYYLDRPDVMSVFSTKITAEKARYPILLSNGNRVDQGELANGRHWVKWVDPFKKPSYLFALVGGDLACYEDTFTTQSGRSIALQIFVEPQDLDKCDHAMASLKQAMHWDEQVYGREYDLDIYMIVAVSHFNMGAMENKGLNIFNTSCVLANPKTSTDDRFERVAAVIAHEYFHNWSGNRVTCRDWFQLSLKEGFTVFRDQEFSADLGSRAVKRVEDVRLLRTVQFAEDAGPMAHPVRPSSYIEINNFYTVTVYEKGAEIVRMIHTLVGAEGFRQGSDLYFERHDGQAVTTDHFVAAMEAANSIDLTQFKRWYEQAGTPELVVVDDYNADTQTYRLTLSQSCPATPKQPEKQPFHIPVKLGLVTMAGEELSEHAQVFSLKEREQSIEFNGIAERPIPSLLRGFSAPVRLQYAYSPAQLKVLMLHDSDPFNRWEASNQLALKELFQLLKSDQAGCSLALSDDYLAAVSTLLAQALSSDADPSQQQVAQVKGKVKRDPAALALMLTLPSEAYMAEEMTVVDVDGIHRVRRFIRSELGLRFRSEWLALYDRCSVNEEDVSDAAQVAQRRLKQVALSYLGTLADDREVAQNCMAQYRTAENMTDQMGALSVLVREAWSESTEYLAAFFEQWQNEPLVIDQWFSLQASVGRENTLDKVIALLSHPKFEMTSPNKVRALIGVFCSSNPIAFHRLDGRGYQFLADQILVLNELNPQIAARLVSPLSRWRRHVPQRQSLMQAELKRILNQPDLSPDVYEIVSKSLDSTDTNG